MCTAHLVRCRVPVQPLAWLANAITVRSDSRLALWDRELADEGVEAADAVHRRLANNGRTGERMMQGLSITETLLRTDLELWTDTSWAVHAMHAQRGAGLSGQDDNGYSHDARDALEASRQPEASTSGVALHLGAANVAGHTSFLFGGPVAVATLAGGCVLALLCCAGLVQLAGGAPGAASLLHVAEVRIAGLTRPLGQRSAVPSSSCADPC
jgi:hypothetical protein